jgi:hypothetical protein
MDFFPFPLRLSLPFDAFDDAVEIPFARVAAGAAAEEASPVESSRTHPPFSCARIARHRSLASSRHLAQTACPHLSAKTFLLPVPLNKSVSRQDAQTGSSSSVGLAAVLDRLFLVDEAAAGGGGGASSGSRGSTMSREKPRSTGPG